MRQTRLDPTKTGDEGEALEFGLRSKVIGQEDAIHQVVEMYQTYLSGMSSPRRPIANLMFLGPTGSGKTRLVEALAECLLGDSRAIVKIDCAEFQHSHEISKLIGSPPGYIGHRETNSLLTQEALNRHHTDKVKMSIVLFDEIEKANDAVWNLMLGILDKATLALGDNSKVDFSRTMVFMTSNIGAREMNAVMKPRLGFITAFANRREASEVNESWSTEMIRSGIDAARRKFTPEFINRIDKMVVFRPLTDMDLNRILELELNSVQERVLSADNGPRFVFSVKASGRHFLLSEGTNVEFGARHLKRAIDRLVVQPLSRLIASGQILDGNVIEIDYTAQSATLTFTRLDEGFCVPGLTGQFGSRVTGRVRNRLITMTTMNKTTTRTKKALYWASTGLAALALAAIGAADLARVPNVMAGLAHLGYPTYLATIIGVWKLLAVATILAPGHRRLKEWAYAGLFFVLTGAATSHAISRDPAGEVVFPLISLGTVLMSWALQSAHRVSAEVSPIAP
jgi:ATP-dependent protease Clp ATPase subunit